MLNRRWEHKTLFDFQNIILKHRAKTNLGHDRLGKQTFNKIVNQMPWWK